MDRSFPAISIQQPWAELIVSGVKQLEIREWSTSYRGDLWLHTGKKRNEALEKYFSVNDLFRGGYIGIVELSLIIPMDKHRWESMRAKHLVPSPFLPGTFGWVLSKPRRFKKPIAGLGKLKLFFPEEELMRKLLDAEII
jgi:hypothetical protein